MAGEGGSTLSVELDAIHAAAHAAADVADKAKVVVATPPKPKDDPGHRPQHKKNESSGSLAAVEASLDAKFGREFKRLRSELNTEGIPGRLALTQSAVSDLGKALNGEGGLLERLERAEERLERFERAEDKIEGVLREMKERLEQLERAEKIAEERVDYALRSLTATRLTLAEQAGELEALRTPKASPAFGHALVAALTATA